MNSKNNKSSYLVFLVMIIMPVIAMIKLSQHIDIIYIAGYFILISFVTFTAYQVDKKQAEKGEWRIREITLHLYEILGGWAAALCAHTSSGIKY